MSTISAAELGGIHIGRVIVVRAGDETVIQDEVAGLIHEADTTLVKFKHVEPSRDHALLNTYGGASFKLDHNDQVEVIEP